MSEVKLKATKREGTGKQVAKKLRRNGLIPAIYYFHGQDSIPIAIDAKGFQTMLSEEVTIVDLEFDNGDVLPSVIREIQWDPVTTKPLHVDFLGVKLDEAVTVEVPLHLVGTPNGVKNQGGVLQFLVRAVEIECLPRDIPEHIEVDVSGLNVHDSITVGDLETPNFQIITDPETVIASVVPPRIEVEAEEAEVEEEQEPEVVSKKKEEEEEKSQE